MKLKQKLGKILLLISFLIIYSDSFAQKSFGLEYEKWGTKKIIRKALRENVKGNYLYAREMLEHAHQKDSNNFELNYQLGLNYFVYTSDAKESALDYFDKALKNTKKDTLPELVYFLGQSYQQTAQFDSAIVKYNQFIPFISDNKQGKELRLEVNNRIAQSNLGKSFVVEEVDRIRIENLGSNINTQYREYAQVVDSTEEYLMFTARRVDNVGGLENIDYLDELHYEDMFISRKGEDGKYEFAERFVVSDKFVGLIDNTPNHEAVVSLSKDEKKLLTYRENNLWISTFNEDSAAWTGPVRLDENINPRKTWQPHGSLTSDGQKLYFSSNRKGGFGELDLYVSEYIDDTTWSEPTNLGPVLNTKLNEDSPFISADGNVLYFSSQGHNSMGGYDIFRTELVDGEWTKPENIGRPINSPSDDIYFSYVGESRYAYFTSNRPEGLGDLDIYRVTYLKDEAEFDNLLTKEELLEIKGLGLVQNVPDTFIVGKDYNINSRGTYVEDGVVKNIFWDLGDSKVKSGDSLMYAYDEVGEYEVRMEVQAIDEKTLQTNTYGLKKKVVVITQEEYDEHKEFLAMERAKQKAIPEEIRNEYAQLTKERDILKAAGAGDDNKRLQEVEEMLLALENKKDDILAKVEIDEKLAVAAGFGLGTVYFSFDKYYLHPTNMDVLENNLKVLKDNKDLEVVLLGHTDNRATHEYNLILSRNRAKSVYEYLVKNGVEKDRLEFKGVATTQPENRCKVGVECTEEEHAINRRVEFYVDGKKMADKKLNGPSIVRQLKDGQTSSNTSGARRTTANGASTEEIESVNEVTLKEATLAKLVEDLTPQDEGLAFNVEDGKVYCYSNVLSPEGYEGHITHVWKLNGEETASIKLKVKGPRWRTYSLKHISPDLVGDWTVEVLDADGKLLKDFAFTVK